MRLKGGAGASPTGGGEQRHAAGHLPNLGSSLVYMVQTAMPDARSQAQFLVTRSIQLTGLIASLGLALKSSAAIFAADAGSHEDIQIVTRPNQLLIERRDDRQLVNSDFLIINHASKSYRLVAIKMSVFDRSGKLELARELNENGKPPALDMVGERILAAGAVIDVYQPFYEFGGELDLDRLHMEFLFLDAEKSASPVSIAVDQIASTDLRPRQAALAAYCLPLRGLVLVHDGHDYYSHHRRYNLAERFRADPESAVSANLYAYDIMRATREGVLFRGDPQKKENWLSYGEPIFAPAGGLVIDAVSDLPDNTFDETGNAKSPSGVETRDPQGFGNHVTIRHADGRVSWLLHMQTGSVLVKAGDAVLAGDLVGKIGFTGDSLFPHLHYTVTNSATYPSQGIPSYFANFSRVLGSRRIRMKIGQIDTGDIVDDAGSCR